MSRHRNIRRLNYDEECEGFDDVYGRSVEDDPYCVSPGTASQFMYDRSAGQHAIAAFFPSDKEIPEEEDGDVDEGSQPSLPSSRRDGERQNSFDNQFPILNPLDEARLRSCLDEIRNIVGDLVPEKTLIDAVLENNFDLERALHSLLETTTTFDAPKQRELQAKQKNDDSLSNTASENLKISQGKTPICDNLAKAFAKKVSFEQLSHRQISSAPDSGQGLSLLKPFEPLSGIRPLKMPAKGRSGLANLAEAHSIQQQKRSKAPNGLTLKNFGSSTTAPQVSPEENSLAPLSLSAKRRLEQKKTVIAQGSGKSPIFGFGNFAKRNLIQTDKGLNDERNANSFVPDLCAALIGQNSPRTKRESGGTPMKIGHSKTTRLQAVSAADMLLANVKAAAEGLSRKTRARSAILLMKKPSLFARVLCLRLRRLRAPTSNTSIDRSYVKCGFIVPFNFFALSPDARVRKAQSKAFGPMRLNTRIQSGEVLGLKRDSNIGRGSSDTSAEMVSVVSEELTRLTVNSDFSGLIASERGSSNSKNLKIVFAGQDARASSPITLSPERTGDLSSLDVSKPISTFSDSKECTPTNKPTAKATRDAAVVKAAADAAEAEYVRVRGGGKDLLNLVVIGHVDAGKSTLMGHLLWLLGAVNKKQMHKYEQESKKIGKSSFMYAWVLDETGEERSRGVTMDVGYSRFETASKIVTLLDAPGHKDFIPNMITGATQADVATLVVDATRGEFETGFESGGQTREHALLVRSLGVFQLLVAVNKLDTVGWSQERYTDIVKKLGQFLKQAGFKETGITYVPCSGLTGENLIASPTEEGLVKWYSGPTLLEKIDAFQAPARPVTKPFRLCVSDVFKGQGGTFSVSGKVETGVVRAGDRITIMPVGESATIKGLAPVVGGGGMQDEDASPYWGCGSAFAGDQVILSLSNVEMASVSVGSVLCDPIRPIRVATRFIARIVVFNIEFPITRGFQAVLHYQAMCEPIIVKRLISQLHKSTGEAIKKKPRCLMKQSNAVVELETSRAICIEVYKDIKEMGRFMLRSAGTTVAAGIVNEIM